ncbi:QcrA and Rieske domain-containing protein [Fischerella sp. PCC 9605]|uniref:QcrA and Rieske domain-containing protein n=1 Tax=Fischerella sp. PCC 9605 TaxID=1173024 RepID=UPI000478C658|nr:ubiquinol-cytochrome c reductase iron-sulfur subunit [Fischerella sp. PCC 9605]
MNRREFIGWVGVGSLASSLPVVIAACSSQTKSQQSTPPTRADGFQEVGAVTELDKNGQILSEEAAAGKVLIIRDPSDTSKLIALNPTCTHKGCIVGWKKDQNALVCPCHGSKFANDGKVINGPAQKPLPTYIAKLEGDVVLVKAV